MPEENENQQLEQELLEAVQEAMSATDPNEWEQSDEDATKKDESEKEALLKAIEEEYDTDVTYSQWIERGNIYIPTDNSKRVKKVKPGFYNLRANEKVGPYMFR